MDDKPKRCVLVLHETILQAVVKDLISFAMVAGVIGIGWRLGSPAMQWAGFAILCLAVFVRSATRQDSYQTPQQVADRMAREYRVWGSEVAARRDVP